MAFAAAGKEPLGLFQIGFPEGFALVGVELASAKKYAGPYDAELFNCANLSLVYLRLIKNPDEYLETCSSRKKTTEFEEINETLRRAVESGGAEMPPLVLGETLLRIPLSEGGTPLQGMRQIGEGLLPGYATLLGIEYEGGSNHLVVLRRRESDKQLVYVDPQVYDVDGKWPLTRVEAIPYEDKIVAFYSILGPTLPRGLFSSFKYRYDPTQLGTNGILMRVNKEGGRRPKRKTLRRRKGISSRKNLRPKPKK